MDNFRAVQSAVYDMRRTSGDAILSLLALRNEISIHRRVLAKLTDVCPELVDAAVLEVQLEDIKRNEDLDE